MTLLLIYACGALVVSFLCSLLEAALLSLPDSYIEMLLVAEKWYGRELKAMKEDLDRPLSAILTLNTVAHTVGAAGVGAEAAVIYGHNVVGVVSAVMTFLILVLSEIIPKTLGAVYCRRLAGFTAGTVQVMMIVTFPVVIFLDWFRNAFGLRATRTGISKSELLASLRLGRQAGILGRRELMVVSNLLALSKVKISDILTPRTVVFGLHQDKTVGDVIRENASLPYSRIPIYDVRIDDTGSYVSRFKIYEEYARGRSDRNLNELAIELRAVPEQWHVAQTFERMLKSGQHIMSVVDEYGGLEGIVTMEDIIETLLGIEIVDESDLAVDLRDVARRLREQRASGK